MAGGSIGTNIMPVLDVDAAAFFLYHHRFLSSFFLFFFRAHKKFFLEKSLKVSLLVAKTDVYD